MLRAVLAGLVHVVGFRLGLALSSQDRFMSRDELTAAAKLIQETFDWSKAPILRGVLEGLPPDKLVWHEVVALTLFSLEADRRIRERARERERAWRIACQGARACIGSKRTPESEAADAAFRQACSLDEDYQGTTTTEAASHAEQKIDAEFDDLVCIRCGAVCDDNVSAPGDRCLCDGLFFSRHDAEVITERGLMLAEHDGSILYSQLPQHDEGRPHIVDGKFQSDKYPTTPRGKVPLSVKDKNAQDLLWQYAQRRRAIDAEFSADLEFALKNEGFEGGCDRR